MGNTCSNAVLLKGLNFRACNVVGQLPIHEMEENNNNNNFVGKVQNAMLGDY